MRLTLLAIGQRQPAWAEQAWAEYSRRFPPEWRFELKALKAESRAGRTVAQCLAAEAQRLEQALGRGGIRVVLDEQGSRTTTAGLAARLEAWRAQGRDVALLIGGPDGLDERLKHSADETLRLSDLTLPHALARVLLAEALYRAWAVNAGHPYHRE